MKIYIQKGDDLVIRVFEIKQGIERKLLSLGHDLSFM
jgi:hypothetical protein